MGFSLMIREWLEGRKMSSVTAEYPSNYLKYEDLINKPEVCKRRGVTLSRWLGGTFTTCLYMIVVTVVTQGTPSVSLLIFDFELRPRQTITSVASTIHERDTLFYTRADLAKK